MGMETWGYGQDKARQTESETWLCGLLRGEGSDPRAVRQGRAVLATKCQKFGMYKEETVL